MEGHELGFDEGEGGLETLLLIEEADAGFDGGGFAEGLKEAVGGHADGEGIVDAEALGEDAAAGIEREDGVADPGEFDLFTGALFGIHTIGAERRREPEQDGGGDFREGRGRWVCEVGRWCWG